MTKCSGVDALTGSAVEVTFAETIASVAPGPSSSKMLVAPGWIDLQVNGFAGVDYNDPSTAIDEVARSIRAMFAAGVTRFFPTVITGPPDGMLACLRNLAR